MKQRIIALAVVAGLFIGGVGAAIVLSSDDGKLPDRLALVPGESTGREGAAAADAMMYPYRNVEYRVVGDLPALDASARAYRLFRGDAAARVARLASALGLGTVEKDGETWHASRTEGDRTFTLTVYDGPELSWSYFEGTYEGGGVVGTGRVEPGVEGGEGSGGSDGSGVSGGSVGTTPGGDTSTDDTTVTCDMPECPEGQACAQVCPEPSPDGTVKPEPVPEPPTDLPSVTDAERMARDLLTAAGIDIGDADITATDDTYSVSVSVVPEVGGSPVAGLGIWFSYGSKGVLQNASGFLSSTQPADEYPLVGTAAGAKRLGDPRYTGYGYAVMAMEGGAVADDTPAVGVKGDEPVSQDSGGTTVATEPGSTEPSQCKPQPDGSEICVVEPAPGTSEPEPGTEPEPVPEPGTVPEPEPYVVDVVGAHLGLVLSADASGTLWLVPAYVFDIRDAEGNTWEESVLALPDEYLPPPPTTVPGEPQPLPAERDAG